MKTEVHNVSQRRQRRTDRHMYKKLVKVGHAVPEICSRTNKQTDTLITILRPTPYRRRSNNEFSKDRY